MHDDILGTVNFCRQMGHPLGRFLAPSPSFDLSLVSEIGFLCSVTTGLYFSGPLRLRQWIQIQVLYLRFLFMGCHQHQAGVLSLGLQAPLLLIPDNPL